MSKINEKNLKVLESLVIESKLVMVMDQSIEISLPSRGDRLEIMQATMAGVEDEKPEMAQIIENNLNATIIAIRACCGLENDEQAYGLFAASGGETGDLAREVQQMAGIRLNPGVADAVQEGGADDPT